MNKKILTLTFILSLHTSLLAMDLNETAVIIDDAVKATKSLQVEFSSLINTVITPTKIESQKTVDTNSSQISRNKVIKNIDKNETLELNTTTPADNSSNDANLGTSAQGLIIFKTKIKPYCKINGDKFAKQYMQEDWDDIYHDKDFKIEIIKACPKMETRYKDEWTPHLYQFTLEYASDSDAIPEC